MSTALLYAQLRLRVPQRWRLSTIRVHIRLDWIRFCQSLLESFSLMCCWQQHSSFGFKNVVSNSSPFCWLCCKNNQKGLEILKSFLVILLKYFFKRLPYTVSQINDVLIACLTMSKNYNVTIQVLLIL